MTIINLLYVSAWGAVLREYSMLKEYTFSTIIEAGVLLIYGPGSVVAKATGYGLYGPWIEFRWGARFSAPVQTGPGAHPASCTMGTRSFPGVVKERPGRDSDPSPPSSAVVIKG
jgi:hypothetical protein